MSVINELSPSIVEVITLCNNICELIIISNKRKEAKDVMRALEIYAKSKNIIVPQDGIDFFYDRLLDARPDSLVEITSGIANAFIRENSKKKSR